MAYFHILCNALSIVVSFFFRFAKNASYNKSYAIVTRHENNYSKQSIKQTSKCKIPFVISKFNNSPYIPLKWMKKELLNNSINNSSKQNTITYQLTPIISQPWKLPFQNLPNFQPPLATSEWKATTHPIHRLPYPILPIGSSKSILSRKLHLPAYKQINMDEATKRRNNCGKLTKPREPDRS